MRCPLCDCRGGVLRRSKIKSNNSFFLKHNKDYFTFSNSRFNETRMNPAVESSKNTPESKAAPLTIFSINRPSKANLLLHQANPKSSPSDHLENIMTSESQILSNNQKSDDEEAFEENPFVSESTPNQSPISQIRDFSSSHMQYLESERFAILRLHMLSQKHPQPFNETISPLLSSDIKTRKPEQPLLALLNIPEANSRHASDSKQNGLHKYDELNLLYDFYRETFKFSKEELMKNEPVPEYAWIHACCAFWIPELYCSENFENLDITAISKLDKNRFTIPCIICNSTRGAVISCCGSNCEEWFHAECARRAKLHFEIQQTPECKFFAYCPKHTTLPCKKKLDSQNQKSVDEIMKFHKHFKRFLKNNKLLSDDALKRVPTFDNLVSEIQGDEASLSSKVFCRKLSAKSKKQVKSQRPQIEHMVKHLPYEYKYFLRYLRDEIEFESKYSFHVHLTSNKEGGYQLKTVTQPKNIFVDELHRDNRIWRRLADSLQITAKAAHKKYQSLIDQLKILANNYQSQNSNIPGNKLNDSQSSPMMSPTIKNGNYEARSPSRDWSNPRQFYCLSVEPLNEKYQNNQESVGCKNCGELFHKHCVENWVHKICVEADQAYCLNCRNAFKCMSQEAVCETDQVKLPVKPLRPRKKVWTAERELDMRSCISKLLSENDCYQIDCFLRSSQPKLFVDRDFKGIEAPLESNFDSRIESFLMPEISPANNQVLSSINPQSGPLESKNGSNPRDKTVVRFDLNASSYSDPQSQMLIEDEHPRATS